MNAVTGSRTTFRLRSHALQCACPESGCRRMSSQTAASRDTLPFDFDHQWSCENRAERKCQRKLSVWRRAFDCGLVACLCIAVAAASGVGRPRNRLGFPGFHGEPVLRADVFVLLQPGHGRAWTSLRSSITPSRTASSRLTPSTRVPVLIA